MRLHSEGETKRFLHQRAAEMRRWPTPAERKLWEMLAPLGFVRQAPVIASRKGATFPYILDFYHPGARLCVEADGGVHERMRGRDRRRDSRLALMDIRTLRFSNGRILEEPARVLAEIREAT